MAQSKNLIPLAVALLLSNPSWAQYSCAEHEHFLTLDAVGTEHVNHRLQLNGKLLIRELAAGSWFIEKVDCAPDGFDVVASHVQYNDPDRKKFHISVLGANRYRIRQARGRPLKPADKSGH